MIEQAGVLHRLGITPALGAEPAATLREAVRRARAAGVPVSLDLNFRSRALGRGRAAPVFRELAARRGHPVRRRGRGRASPSNATRRSAPDALAEALAALGPSEVVVKLGRRGARALVDGESIRGAGRGRCTRSTPVGAGDAFVAGYLASRLLGARGPRPAVDRRRDGRLRGDRPRQLGGVPPAARADVAHRGGGRPALSPCSPQEEETTVPTPTPGPTISVDALTRSVTGVLGAVKMLPRTTPS